MASRNRELGLAVSIGGRVDRSLGNSIGEAGSKLATLKKKAATVAKAAAVSFAAIGTAAIAAGSYLYNLADSFDGAYDAIRIGTGATGVALEELQDSFKDVYGSVPTDMESASQAIADYNTRLGLTGDTLETVSIQAIQVSAALGDDLGGVIEYSSKTFEQWNIAQEDMAGAMDYLFKASQSTGVGFTELATYTQQYGAQLQELGYSFEDAVSLVGQLEKAGVNTAETLAAMKKSVGALAKEGYSAQEGFAHYTEAIKDAKDMTEATTIANEIFGTRAGSTMAAAIRNGTVSVDELTASLLASQETISGCAEDTYDFADKLQLFKQQAEIALEPAAMTLLDSLNAMLPTLASMLTAISPLIAAVAAQLSGLFDSFLPVVVALSEELMGALIPVIEQLIADILPPLMKLITSILPIVSKIISSLLPPLISLISMLLPPVLQIVELILPIIIQLLDALMPSLQLIIGAIMPPMVQLLSLVIPILSQVINTILPMVVSLLSQLLPPLLSIVSAILPIAVQWLETIWPLLMSVFTALSPIFDLLLVMISPLLQVFEALSPLIVALGEIAFTLLQPLIPMIEMLADVLDTVLTPVLDTITVAFEGKAEAISSMIGYIVEAVGWLSGSIAEFLGISGNVDVAVNAVSGAEELPQFATGGIVTGPTKAIVGEGGEPEAIIPLSKLDEVLTTVATPSVAFAPVININGTASKQDVEDALDYSFEKFKEYMAMYCKEARRVSL